MVLLTIYYTELMYVSSCMLFCRLKAYVIYAVLLLIYCITLSELPHRVIVEPDNV